MRMKTSQSSLYLVLILTTVFTTNSVRANSCPEHISRVTHGQSTVYKNTCYLFVNNELYWGDARDECWKLGGEMLTIENGDTAEFIKKALDYNELRWQRKGVWLGAEKVSGAWRWINGKALTFTNWAHGQPKTVLRIIHDCLQMRQEDGWKWHNSVCSLPKFHYNYICQFPLNQPGETASEVSDDQSKNKDNTSILVILVGIGVSLLIVIGTIALIFLLSKSCKKQNSSGQIVQPRNNTSCRPSSLASQPDYQVPSGFTDQTQFSSNDALYMTPNEVMKSNSHQQSINNNLNKNCNYCYVLTGGASNSNYQSQNEIQEMGVTGPGFSKLDQNGSLKSVFSKINGQLFTSTGCHHYVNQGDYVEMKNKVVGNDDFCAKELEKKHIYSNVDQCIWFRDISSKVSQ